MARDCILAIDDSKDNRSKLEAIMHHSEDPIIAIGSDENITLMNRAAQAVFRVEDESIGMPLTAVIDRTDIIELFGLGGKERSSRQAEIQLDNGRVYLAHVTIVKHVGCAAVMQEITRFKELDRVKSELVSIVSHDVRSPLTAILGYAELLSRAGPINETQAEFIGRIRRNVHNITALISDQLDVARIEAGLEQEIECYHLPTLIQDVVNGMRHRADVKSQTFELELPSHLPPSHGNPLRLRQAVRILIGNAIKYAPERGKVLVTVNQQDEQIVMRVQDDGIGIPAADQPSIFEGSSRAEEATRPRRRTRLGLPTVKSVVEHHQGQVWVESDPGKGSTFTIVLPITAEPPEQPSAERPPLGNDRAD